MRWTRCSRIHATILSLRQPAEKLWSVYLYNVYKRESLQNSLRDGLDHDWHAFLERCERVNGLDENDLRKGEPDWVAHRLLDEGRYDDVLEDWLEALGERLKVVFFDELRREPRAVARDLFAWLGVDPDHPLDLEARNTTVWAAPPAAPPSAPVGAAHRGPAGARTCSQRPAVRLYQRVGTTRGAPRGWTTRHVDGSTRSTSTRTSAFRALSRVRATRPFPTGLPPPRRGRRRRPSRYRMRRWARTSRTDAPPATGSPGSRGGLAPRQVGDHPVADGDPRRNAGVDPVGRDLEHAGLAVQAGQTATSSRRPRRMRARSNSRRGSRRGSGRWRTPGCRTVASRGSATGAVDDVDLANDREPASHRRAKCAACRRCRSARAPLDLLADPRVRDHHIGQRRDCLDAVVVEPVAVRRRSCARVVACHRRRSTCAGPR